MLYLLHHLLALAALGAAGWLSGSLLLPWPRERLGAFFHLAAFCLGLAYWSMAVFVLAAAALLYPAGLAAPAAVLAAVAWYRRPAWPWRRAVASSARPPGGRGGDLWRRRAAPLAAGLVLAGVLVLTFASTVSPLVVFDASVYHLTLPRLYAEHGGFRAVEMNVYSNWPLAAQMLYAAALLLGGYTVAKAVHFGFGLLVLYALWVACASRRNSWPAGWLAAAFFLANGVVAFEMRTAYVDLAHAFFFLAAFLFLERAAAEEDPSPWLLLAGIAGGMVAGIKVSGAVGVALLGALYLPRIAAAPRTELRRFLLRFAAPAVALWLPWLAKAAWMTGNPFYPFFHPWLGGDDWSPELGEHLRAWHREVGMGRGAADYLLLPLRLILLGGHGYERFDGEIGAFWLVLLPLALAGGLGRSGAPVRRTLAVAALFFAAWAAASQQTRLLIPVLPLLALAAALAVAGFAERVPRPGLRTALEAAAVAGALALVVSTYGDLVRGGARNVAAFSRLEGDPRASAVPPYLRFVNESLPADARLLMLNTNQGFFCEREYLADSFFEASQIADYLAGAASPEEVRRRLEARGVTHVVLDRRARPRRIAFPLALGQLLGEETDVLFRSADGRFEVRELRPKTPG